MIERADVRMVRSERASRWLLASAIALAALGVGAVHTATLCVVAVLAAAAAALAWWYQEPCSLRPAAGLLLVTGVGLVGYTLLQCIPMPLRWMAWIAPYNADVWGRALSPLGVASPPWAPLSLDPKATHVELLKGLTYLAAFLAVLRTARSRQGVTFLGHVIIVTASVVALAAVLHPAFGARRLFGLYDPGPAIADRHIAPLMNPNNLAGYLNLAICLALAGALGSGDSVPKPILAAGTTLLGAAQVWIGSRGGVIAMILGGTIVIAITALSKHDRRSTISPVSALIGLTIVAGGAMVVLGGSEGASTDLLHGDASKLTLFLRFFRMLPSVAVFGCGRGAFESTFPAFRTDPGHETYAYPEQFVAQWVLEWGVPVGVVGLLAVAFALQPNAMLARSRTACGAWAGLVALTVQNLADLGTEIPGVMLAGVTCAGIVVAGTAGERRRRQLLSSSGRPRMTALLCAAAVTMAVPIAAMGAPRELHADQRRLYRLALDPSVSPAQMHDAAREAILRHPAEPYLPFAVSIRAAKRADDNPMPWIEATLERATTYAPAHLVLAQVLRRVSRSQARFEYRTAVAQWPSLAKMVGAQAVDLVRSYSDAIELVAPGEAGTDELRQLVPALQVRLPATATRLDAEIMSRAPADVGPANRAAEAAIEDLEAGDSAPWCQADRDACARDALALAGRAEALSVGDCAGHALHARAELASGHPQQALDELSKSVDLVVNRIECLEALVLLDEQVKDGPRIETDLSRLANAGCTGDDECAAVMSWIADREERHGNERRALAMYEKAAERTPDDKALVQAVARLAARAGLHAEAARSYEHLAQLFPNDHQWAVLAAREQGLAFQGTFP